jgi:hypothetical protein
MHVYLHQRKIVYHLVLCCAVGAEASYPRLPALCLSPVLLSLPKQSSNAGRSRLDLPLPATSGAIAGIHGTPSSSSTRSPHSPPPRPPGTTSPPDPSAIVPGSGGLAAVPYNDDSYLLLCALHLHRLVQQRTRPCPSGGSHHRPCGSMAMVVATGAEPGLSRPRQRHGMRGINDTPTANPLLPGQC